MYNSNLISPNTTVTNTPDLDAVFGGMAAGVIVLVITLGLLALAIAVFMIIAQCKMYTKAGEKWWKVFIPIYNTWTETKITGLAWWWCPLFVGITCLAGVENFSVLGFAIILISFNYNFNLAKKFGKSNGFAVLCTLLPIIGIPILAFGSAKYDAKAATDKNGIFAIDKDSLVK